MCIKCIYLMLWFAAVKHNFKWLKNNYITFRFKANINLLKYANVTVSPLVI